MQPKWVAISAYATSVLVFLFASLAGRVRVVTAQPNGLAEVQYPYSGISFFATVAAFGVLLYGVILSFVVLRGRLDSRRTLLGSGLLSAGILAILFAGFWTTVEMQDEGPRCINGCPLSTLQFYEAVYVASAILAVLGLIIVIYGTRFLTRKTSLILSKPTEASLEIASG